MDFLTKIVSEAMYNRTCVYNNTMYYAALWAKPLKS